jgi:transcriptional regulator with XRE-family HTH domain
MSEDNQLSAWLGGVIGRNKQFRSAQDLSVAAGLNQNTVDLILKGERADPKTLLQLARVLDVSPTNAFRYAGWLSPTDLRVRLSRPLTLVIGIILLILMSLLYLMWLVYLLPLSNSDAQEFLPPAAITYTFIAAGVLGIVAAFALWRMKRWGWILALILLGIDVLAVVPEFVFTPEVSFDIVSIVGTAVEVVIIVLLLTPSSRRALT